MDLYLRAFIVRVTATRVSGTSGRYWPPTSSTNFFHVLIWLHCRLNSRGSIAWSADETLTEPIAPGFFGFLRVGPRRTDLWSSLHCFMGHGRKGREGVGAEEVAGVDDIKEEPAVVHLEVNVTGGTCLAQAEGNIQDGIILNE